MRFLIHKPHGAVSVDNADYPVDTSAIASNILFVGFNDTGRGYIEYTDRPTVDEPHFDPSAYQSYINAWLTAAAADTNPLTLAQAKAVKQAFVDQIYYGKRNTLIVSYHPMAFSTVLSGAAPGVGANAGFSTGGWVLSNGNLTITDNNGVSSATADSLPVPGQYYWEVAITGGGPGQHSVVGVIAAGDPIAGQFGNSGNSFGYYGDNGNKIHAGAQASYGTAFADPTVIGVAFDSQNGNLWFSQNGVWQHSATLAEIAAGDTTHAAFTAMPLNYYAGIGSDGSTSTFNFGPTYTYTPPSGYGPPTLAGTANIDASDLAVQQLGTQSMEAISYASIVGQVPSMQWVATDGTILTLQGVNIPGLLGAVGVPRLKLMQSDLTLKNAIAALTSISAVISFDATSGWPF